MREMDCSNASGLAASLAVMDAWVFMWWHPGHILDSDWDALAAGDPVLQWALGVVGSAVCIGFGLVCILTRSARWPLSQWDWHLYGGRAVAVGIASLGVGLILHGQWFWGPRNDNAAVLLKIAGLLAMIGGLGYLIVRTFAG